jgi:hypothetical protein
VNEFTRWLGAFAATVALELPIAGLFCRRFEPCTRRLLAKLFFANLATHPLVWFAFPMLPLGGFLPIVAAEAFAFSAEAAFFLTVFPGLRPARAWAASLVANAFSFCAGLGLHLLLRWPS